jgi:cystathionine beta-lyase/cystathionine gamma-synthase
MTGSPERALATRVVHHPRVEATRLAILAVSLGGVETLVEHSASTSHALLSNQELEKAGIPAGLIRMSAGIADATELIADVHQALDPSGGES